jgi:membrane protease YdiL (CAAX protease family)
MRRGRDVPGAGEPDPAPDRPGPAKVPAEAVKATLVGIVTTVLAAWAVGGTLRLMSTPRPVVVAVYYMVIFAGLIRTALLAGLRWGSGRFRVDFGWWARPTDTLRAVVIMFAGVVAGTLAVAPWRGRWTTNAAWVSSADTTSVVVFALFAVIVAPLVEELVFRGLLQRSLTSRYGARRAVLIQGAVFGLYHFNLTGGAGNLPTIVYIAAWGTVMGAAAHRYRRLGPTMAAHALSNILAVAALIAR